MFTSILLSTVLLSPAAPAPKATKPLGPPPVLVYVNPARANGQVVITVQTPRTVTETVQSVVNENGVPVTKTTTREVAVMATASVPLESAGATFKTAADKALTAEDVNEKLKAGGVLFVPAAGQDEIDPAYAKILSADAILVRYTTDKADEKKRIAVTTARVGTTIPPLPTVVAVRNDDKGVLNVPARGTKEVTVKVPVQKVENGQTTVVYEETKQALTALVPTPFDQVKPGVTTAEGKPVAAEDAKKQLAAGAIVLVSGDGKPVDEAYRKLFQPNTLALASEKMVLAPTSNLRPALRGGAIVPAPAQAVPAKEVKP